MAIETNRTPRATRTPLGRSGALFAAMAGVQLGGIRRRGWIRLACSLPVLVGGTEAAGQCQYDVTALSYPLHCSFGPVFTYGGGLNEHGNVVGAYQCPVWTHTEAFLWTPEEGFVTLSRPPGIVSAWAADINDHGVICGEMVVNGVGTRGFVYDAGVWTELPPAIPGNGAWSKATAISNEGLVVGWRSIGDGLIPQNAFIWSADAGFTDLGLMGAYLSAASDVDVAGNVVGSTTTPSQAFLWQQGKLTLLTLPGALETHASAVAAGPVIVGSGVFQEPPGPWYALAYVWERGEFVMIPPVPGYDTSGATDINDAHQSVGLSVKLSNQNDRRGFLWQHGTTYDLNELSLAPGFLVERGRAINNLGQILARGRDSISDVISFVLTPVDVLPGDLDLDCHVGVLDLLAMLAAWGEEAPSADVDGDGIVGIWDLVILLQNWG